MQIKILIKSTARALLLAIIAYSSVALQVQAATLVSGDISANTTWSLAQSPYQVDADISVKNGAVLTIEPGVTVSFDTAKSLTVSNGTLSARGTINQPITFTSNLDNAGSTPASGSWGQIRFLDGTNDNATILEYANIRYGQGVTVQAASPTFNYLNISNSLGSAISIDLSSSPKGVGNAAINNTINGITVPAGEILGSVSWGIKGIPYVVASGVVSVGASPNISGLNISEIQQGETLNAILSGTRLIGAKNVSLSSVGTTAIVQSGVTDTRVPIQLTASPSALLGATKIEMQVDAGSPSLTGSLQVIQPQPSLTGLSPNPVYASQTGNVLNVTGKNFVPASVIRLDGTDLTTVYGSASSLSATLPVLTSGNKSVTVTQPDPLSAGNFLTSKPVILAVIAPLLTLTPSTVSQTQGTSINLTLSIPFPATIGGVAINLSSSANTIASVPASIVIAEGMTSATFTVNTIGVGNVNITARAAGYVDAVTLLTVNSPTMRRYALIPTLTSTTSASTIGTASASSSYEMAPYGVFSAFDNDPSGRWATNTTALGHWLKWSFVTAHTVTEFEYTTDNLLYTELQYSDDDINWFSASAIYQEGQGNFIHSSTTGSTAHRYWRLYVSQVYGATVNNWYGYNKFQLYSDVPLATTASGWYSTSIPNSGTDGKLETGWNAGRFAPAWIAIDLGIIRPINEVRVYAGTGSPAGITNYSIQVSNDSVSWSTVAQASSGAYWTNTPVTATGRYVRLQVNSHSGGSWIALHEFQVY